MMTELSYQIYKEEGLKFSRKISKIYWFVDFFLRSQRSRTIEFINPPESAKILDVATGTGKLAVKLAEKGCDVTAIDFSSDMLKKAKIPKGLKNLNFQQMDATNLAEFDDNTFDITLISFALHDMPEIIQKRILIEMLRVTKKGGNIIIIDYNEYPRLSRNKFFKLMNKFETKYYPKFIKINYQELLEDLGMKIVDIAYSYRNITRIIKCVK